MTSFLRTIAGCIAPFVVAAAFVFATGVASAGQPGATDPDCGGCTLLAEDVPTYPKKRYSKRAARKAWLEHKRNAGKKGRRDLKRKPGSNEGWVERLRRAQEKHARRVAKANARKARKRARQKEKIPEEVSAEVRARRRLQTTGAGFERPRRLERPGRRRRQGRRKAEEAPAVEERRRQGRQLQAELERPPEERRRIARAARRRWPAHDAPEGRPSTITDAVQRVSRGSTRRTSSATMMVGSSRSTLPRPATIRKSWRRDARTLLRWYRVAITR